RQEGRLLPNFLSKRPTSSGSRESENRSGLNLVAISSKAICLFKSRSIFKSFFIPLKLKRGAATILREMIRNYLANAISRVKSYQAAIKMHHNGLLCRAESRSLLLTA